MKAFGGIGVITPSIFNLGSRNGQLHGPAALPTRERASSTHRIEGWMHPQKVPEFVDKF
jgi:hypothetical protein